MLVIEYIKKIWKWAISHFWNLFSVVGVIATFYFGLFYIPDYVAENLYSKSALAQQEIIRELGEQFYNGKTVSAKDVEVLIEQKEIFYKIHFPYSSKQTLLLVKNDFSNNYFISLDKRNSLSSNIQSVVDQIKDKQESDKEEPPFQLFATIFSFIATIFVVLTGLISITQKNRKDAELEVELDEENNPFEEGTVRHRDFEFSEMVGEVLNELDVTVLKELRNSPRQPVYEPDFEIQTHKGSFLIETKAYRQKVGINTIRGFLYFIRQNGMSGILVTTSPLTVRARQMVEQHKTKYGKESAHVVIGVTKADIKSGIKNIIH